MKIELPVTIYFYSGTGNTWLVVQEMVKVFHEKGLRVSTRRIEDTDPDTIDREGTMGLAFPVAYQSTFDFLWDFFESMPRTTGTPVFMVDTMMMFSGAIVGPLKKCLERKGYNCIGAREIVMPTNWFPRKIDEKKNGEIRTQGLTEARTYAEDLVQGKTTWGRIPLLSDSFRLLCCNEFMMNNVNTAPGKKIRVKEDICTGCGLCQRLCPMDNISMEGHPLHGDDCEVCMRCLNYCPAEAVFIPGKDWARYRAVSAGKLLSNM